MVKGFVWWCQALRKVFLVLDQHLIRCHFTSVCGRFKIVRLLVPVSKTVFVYNRDFFSSFLKNEFLFCLELFLFSQQFPDVSIAIRVISQMALKSKLLFLMIAHVLLLVLTQVLRHCLLHRILLLEREDGRLSLLLIKLPNLSKFQCLAHTIGCWVSR